MQMHTSAYLLAVFSKSFGTLVTNSISWACLNLTYHFCWCFWNILEACLKHLPWSLEMGPWQPACWQRLLGHTSFLAKPQEEQAKTLQILSRACNSPHACETIAVHWNPNLPVVKCIGTTLWCDSSCGWPPQSSASRRSEENSEGVPPETGRLLLVNLLYMEHPHVCGDRPGYTAPRNETKSPQVDFAEQLINVVHCLSSFGCWHVPCNIRVKRSVDCPWPCRVWYQWHEFHHSRTWSQWELLKAGVSPSSCAILVDAWCRFHTGKCDCWLSSLLVSPKVTTSLL